ncbi:hypothetical protein FE784_38400 [Paenibacillus hemerocallicola]|jgi:hypothetical protein|uniref:Uncharacterized protein n=1 Tax=Paenibacillus hemerocallicola TaxID=1172614 RepID=A0A5C4SWQ0_9BACL|nr:hypothetical protein [Paenibacillus hemerocallicola]TNJ57639.1 hypothetical protein FE784_38400 [Paenibacillus hemerocallicola]
MSPLGAKFIGICVIAVLFIVMRLIFKNTLKGEAGASNLLFIAFVPLYGIALPFVLIFLFKVIYYMLA